jgi:hypothetical protein
MLWVLTNIEKINEFRELFKASHENRLFLDLSKVCSSNLAAEAESVVSHHSNCIIYLGYVEAGWMLTPPDQTRMRKLFRKFPVAVVSFYPESLPYSWKTDTEVIYTEKPNGVANSVNDGSTIQDKSKNGHDKASGNLATK